MRFRLPCFFFFNDTATTEIYTLSLHDALPILMAPGLIAGAMVLRSVLRSACDGRGRHCSLIPFLTRSEEHTSELQSHSDLVCRLLLEKKQHTTTQALAERD